MGPESSGGLSAVTNLKGGAPQLGLWLRQAAEGNPDALGRIYDATSPILMALALRILGRREDAEEALLDVYCKAWQRADLYDEQRGTVMAWLMTMMRTTALDRVRSRVSREARVEVLVEDDPLPASGLDPESLAVSSQQRARIRAALEQLPPEQREALEVAFFEGLTHSEIAERLAIPLGTAKTRVRRGLEKLRSLLDGIELGERH
jgi:RNA polymerase sigma-70 factor, ECF subfamily